MSGGIVEVVHAPDEAPVVVAPGAEILKMRVADGKNRGGIGKIREDIQDHFAPPPIRRAKEGEGALAHLPMLLAKICFDEVTTDLLAQPVFVRLS